MNSLIKIETMEEERLMYSLITQEIPKRVKDTLLRAVEEFEEQRAT